MPYIPGMRAMGAVSRHVRSSLLCAPDYLCLPLVDSMVSHIPLPERSQIPHTASEHRLSRFSRGDCCVFCAIRLGIFLVTRYRRLDLCLWLLEDKQNRARCCTVVLPLMTWVPSPIMTKRIIHVEILAPQTIWHWRAKILTMLFLSPHAATLRRASPPTRSCPHRRHPPYPPAAVSS